MFTLLPILLLTLTPPTGGIWSLMGMEARLAQIPDLVEIQVAEQFGDAGPDPARDARIAVLRRAVDLDTLRSDAEAAFHRRLDARHADAIRATLSAGPLAPLFLRLRDPLDEAMIQAMDAWYNDLADGLSRERITRLMEIDEALRDSETDAMILVNVYLGFVRVMETHLPESERVAEEDIPEIATLMYEELYDAYRSANIGRLAYLLRDESDATLASLSEWLGTEPGKAYASAMAGTIEDVLERIGTRLDP